MKPVAINKQWLKGIYQFIFVCLVFSCLSQFTTLDVYQAFFITYATDQIVEFKQ